MALFDVFKKSKNETKRVNVKKPAVKARPVKIAEKKPYAETPKEFQPGRQGEALNRPSAKVAKSAIAKKDEISLAGKPKQSGIAKIAPRILRSAQITEKAAVLKDSNQYVFRVFENANKNEVKKSVEEVYKVDVLKVRIINIPKKKRRLGRTLGWRKGYKKAIVTIKKGQDIELIPR